MLLFVTGVPREGLFWAGQPHGKESTAGHFEEGKGMSAGRSTRKRFGGMMEAWQLRGRGHTGAGIRQNAPKWPLHRTHFSVSEFHLSPVDFFFLR